MGATDDATSLNALAAQGTVPPDDFTNSPERVAEIAGIPLMVPDLQKVVQEIMQQGLYVRERVEDAVVAALIGNVHFCRSTRKQVRPNFPACLPMRSMCRCVARQLIQSGLCTM